MNQNYYTSNQSQNHSQNESRTPFQNQQHATHSQGPNQNHQHLQNQQLSSQQQLLVDLTMMNEDLIKLEGCLAFVS